MVAEREAPTKPKRQRRSRRPRCEVCPNCGHPIAINYCPNCGQHAADHNSSVWSFIVEFFDEFLQVDSKFLRTVGALIRKPGYLTQEWIKGKRASYISPLKLYVAVNALFFLIVTFKIAPQQSNFGIINFGSSTPEAQRMVEEQARQSHGWFQTTMNNLALKAVHADQAVIRQEFMDHLPTASLILIPICAFVFTALYIRRKRYYLEHLVFLLHVNSFCFVTLGLALFVPWSWTIPIVLLWHCIYVYMAMKRNYEQGWIKTFFKFWIFGVAFFTIVITAIVVTALAAAVLASGTKADQTAGQDKPAVGGKPPASGPQGVQSGAGGTIVHG